MWRSRLLVPLALAAALGFACAEPDPSYGDPGGIAGKKLPNELTGGGGAGGSAFGAAYDANANKPATTLEKAHAAAPGRPAPADADGVDCLVCHKTGGPAANKAFAFGGRVSDKNGPAPDVDVIVLQGDKGDEKVGPVKSDKDGFFWAPAPPLVKAGGKTYVRKGATEKPMGPTLPDATGGGCDSASCHVAGKVGKITI